MLKLFSSDKILQSILDKTVLIAPPTSTPSLGDAIVEIPPTVAM